MSQFFIFKFYLLENLFSTKCAFYNDGCEHGEEERCCCGLNFKLAVDLIFAKTHKKVTNDWHKIECACQIVKVTLPNSHA